MLVYEERGNQRNDKNQHQTQTAYSHVAALVSLNYFSCVAAAIDLRVGGIVLLFYCFLEGLQANHVRPYESCYIAHHI